MSLSIDTSSLQRTEASAIAAGTIAANRFVQMELTAGLSVEQSDGVALEKVMGVSAHSAVAGDRLRLTIAGAAKVIAGDTFTRTTAAHYDVTTDATGRAIPWTAASGLPKLGKWFPESESAIAAGNPIWVLLDTPDNFDALQDAYVAADAVVTAAYIAADVVVTNAFIAADAVVTAAYIAADVVVTNAYIAADVVVTNAFQAADVALLRTFTLTPGAEGAGAANAIDVVVQVVDGAGANVAAIQECEARAYGADMLLGGAAGTNLLLSEQGAGAETSTTAKPTLRFTTDANGAATIRITDNSGALAADVRLQCSTIDVGGGGAIVGQTSEVTVTFA